MHVRVAVLTFPGHQRTWARIIRTDTRMKPKLARKATKKQNSGNRPVCTICVVNHPDMRRYRPRCAGRLILLTCSPPGLVKLPGQSYVAATASGAPSAPVRSPEPGLRRAEGS